jgi:hypothetical protein
MTEFANTWPFFILGVYSLKQPNLILGVAASSSLVPFISWAGVSIGLSGSFVVAISVTVARHLRGQEEYVFSCMLGLFLAFLIYSNSFWRALV